MNNLTSHNLTAINFDDNQQKRVIERFMSRINHADCDTMDDARLQLLFQKSVALQKDPMTAHIFEHKLRRSMCQSSMTNKSKISFCPINSQKCQFLSFCSKMTIFESSLCYRDSFYKLLQIRVTYHFA